MAIQFRRQSRAQPPALGPHGRRRAHGGLRRASNRPARWWLGSEVDSHRGIGVWVEDFEAPDHMYLHMGHENGAHSMVEMSFSYNATASQPRSNFQYELIGTDGIIRYNREERNFEVRNSHGTRHLPYTPKRISAACTTNSTAPPAPATTASCPRPRRPDGHPHRPRRHRTSHPRPRPRQCRESLIAAKGRAGCYLRTITSGCGGASQLRKPCSANNRKGIS